MNIPASGPSLFQPSNILCSSTPMRQNTRKFTNRNSSAEIHLDPSETPIRGPGVRRKTSSISSRNDTKTSQSARPSTATTTPSRSSVVRHVAPNVAGMNSQHKQNMSSNSESDQTESDSCNMTAPQKPVNVGAHVQRSDLQPGRMRNNTYTRKETSGATDFSQNIPVVKSTDTDNDFPTTDFNNEEEMNDLNRTDGKNNVAASTPVFPLTSNREQHQTQSQPKDSVERRNSSEQYTSVSASVPLLRKKVYTDSKSEHPDTESKDPSQNVKMQQSNVTSKTLQSNSGNENGKPVAVKENVHNTFSATKTKDLENQRLKDMRNRPTLQLPETLSSFEDDLLFDSPAVDQRLWTPRTPSESSGTQPRIPHDPALHPEIPAVLPAKSTELTTFSQRSPRWQLNKNYTNVPSEQPSGFRPEPVRNVHPDKPVATNSGLESAGNTSRYISEKQNKTETDAIRGIHMVPKNRNNNSVAPNDLPKLKDIESGQTVKGNNEGIVLSHRLNSDRDKSDSKEPLSANWFTTPADHATHVSQSVSRSGKVTSQLTAQGKPFIGTLHSEETDVKKVDYLEYQTLNERNNSLGKTNVPLSTASQNISDRSSSLVLEQSKKSENSSFKSDYRNSDFSQPGYFSDSTARVRNDSVPTKHKVVHSPVTARQTFNASPVIKDLPSSMNDNSTGLSSSNINRAEGTASPVSSRIGSSAVKTEKLTAGATFSPIHPQPVTNG